VIRPLNKTAETAKPALEKAAAANPLQPERCREPHTSSNGLRGFGTGAYFRSVGRHFQQSSSRIRNRANASEASFMLRNQLPVTTVTGRFLRNRVYWRTVLSLNPFQNMLSEESPYEG
jgi:hypothetical protein